MKVLVSGAHGMVGSELLSLLRSQGHEVVSLVRKPSAGNSSGMEVVWDPSAAQLPAESVSGFDAVVHLAGENIAAGRWTEAKKKAIMSSRVDGTSLLSRALATCSAPPKVFVCASAIGFYGDRGDQVLSESSSSGDGFLADVVRAWEAASSPASAAGIRTVNARFGVVLSKRGGALPKMLPPFQMGAGGRLGSGKQWMSWISLADVANAISYCIDNQFMSGPVNFVAPDAVTNNKFTTTLGAALHRPTIMPVPGLAIHILLGEMADELLLSSTHAIPEKLQQSGYKFIHPTLAECLRAETA